MLAAEIYLDKLWMLQDLEYTDTANVDRPAANVAAQITFAGVVGQRHCIVGVAYSYDGAPTAGNLQITDGGAVVFDVDVTAAGPDWVPIKLRAGWNSDLVITLAAGGAAVSGKLNVLRHWIEFD